MKRKTPVALMGIGGYGRIYLKTLLDPAACDRYGLTLIAAVDPSPVASPDNPAVAARGIPVYATAAEMYAAHRPEVVVLSSPLQCHAEQTVEALANGCHVLCEKPLCVTPEQAWQMKEATGRSAHQVAMPQTMVVTAADASCPRPTPFPSSLVRVSGEIGHRKTSVDGLGRVLIDCYDSWTLPAEAGLSWPVPSVEVKVADARPALKPTLYVSGEVASASVPAV